MDMSSSAECYVMTLGEVVLLQALSSSEFNGAVGVVEGIKDKRVAVRLLHNKHQILVKPENLLEAGGNGETTEVEDSEGLEDCCDYDSDGVPESAEMDFRSDLPPNLSNALKDKDTEKLNQAYINLMDSNLECALAKLSSYRNKFSDNQQGLVEISAHCNAAIEQNDRNWAAYEILGDMHVNNNDDMKAVEAFNSQFRILSGVYSTADSTAITGMFSKVLLKIAAAKGRLLDSHGELEAFLHVSQIDANNVHVFASIGDLLLDSGDISNGIQNFRKAIAIDPSWALGRFHLARALLRNGEKELAFKQLEVAVNDCSSKRIDETIERAAKNFMMISSLADKIHPEQCQSQIAVRALLRSVNILRSDTRDEHSLRQINERDEEEKIAADNNKLSAMAYFQLGQLLENLGASTENKNEPSSLRQSGYYDGAISSYKKSCELDPSDSSYRLALGNGLRIRAHSRKSKEDLDDSIVVYQSGLLIDSGELPLLPFLGISGRTIVDVNEHESLFQPYLDRFRFIIWKLSRYIKLIAYSSY